ncbi:unnamed protein product [Sphagnum balticum]
MHLCYPEHVSPINGADTAWHTTVVECNEFRKRQLLTRTIRKYTVSFVVVICERMWWHGNVALISKADAYKRIQCRNWWAKYSLGLRTTIIVHGGMYNDNFGGTPMLSGFDTFKIVHYFIIVQWIEQPPLYSVYGRDYASQ